MTGVFGLLMTTFLLGLRHGVDWDHIAAIFDIAGTTTSTEIESHLNADPAHQHTHEGDHSSLQAVAGHTQRHAFWLALLYALGHGAMVIVLGIAALMFNTLLPDWIDPIMGRIVGFTLLLLGGWVIYSLVQFSRGRQATFRLQSRWMLVLAGIRQGYRKVRSSMTGEAVAPMHVEQYGAKTAFGIGLIHGIGAETGTQILLITAIGAATSMYTGIGMLLFFVAGLIVSNSVLALAATSGFIGSARARPIYIAIGVLTAVFSIVIGLYFVLGLDTELPDLSFLTGFIPVGEPS